MNEQQLSQSERETAQKEAAAVERKAVQRPETAPVGIGGWLLLFVIAVALNSLLAVFLVAVGLLSGHEEAVKISGYNEAVIGGSLIAAGYGFYVFYLLIRVRPAAPRHAQGWLILVFLLDAFLMKFSPSTIVAGFVTLTWCCYLAWSKRVANTYGQASYAKQ